MQSDRNNLMGMHGIINGVSNDLLEEEFVNKNLFTSSVYKTRNLKKKTGFYSDKAIKISSPNLDDIIRELQEFYLLCHKTL